MVKFSLGASNTVKRSFEAETSPLISVFNFDNQNLKFKTKTAFADPDPAPDPATDPAPAPSEDKKDKTISTFIEICKKIFTDGPQKLESGKPKIYYPNLESKNYPIVVPFPPNTFSLKLDILEILKGNESSLEKYQPLIEKLIVGLGGIKEKVDKLAEKLVKCFWLFDGKYLILTHYDMSGKNLKSLKDVARPDKSNEFKFFKIPDYMIIFPPDTLT